MQSTIKNWLLLLFLACIWGSSFLLMKRGMIHKPSGEFIFSNQQVGVLRMLIASSVMLPFAFRYIRDFKNLKLTLTLALVGFLGNFFPAFLFTYAETGISSGYAGMLNSCTPIFTLLIGALFFHQTLLKNQLIGVGIGTIGIITLVNGVQLVDTSGSWNHVFAVVLATLFYAISVNVIRYQLKGISAIKITSMAFSLTFIPSLILFFYFDTHQAIISNNNAFYGLNHIIVLAVIGTAFSVVLFNYLIAQSSALFASSVTYFIPVVAVLIGFWDGEKLSWVKVIAMFVILCGVYIANHINKRKLL